MATTGGHTPADHPTLKSVKEEHSAQDMEADQAWGGLVKLLAGSTARQPSRQRDNQPLAVSHKKFPEVHEALARICEPAKVLQRRKGRIEMRKNYLDRLRRELFGSYLEKTWWKTSRSRIYDVEEAIAAEEVGREFENREPVRPIHMHKVHDMMDDLVDRLLVEAYRDDEGNVTTPDLLNSAWNQVRMLRSDGYPKYRPPSHDSQAASEAREALNKVNRRVMRDWMVLRKVYAEYRKAGTLGQSDVRNYIKKREYFIGKICHNLLVIEYSPGIQNYNALLSGFLQLGEYNLAKVVVDSFRFNSHLKPTQMTIATILHYHRLTNDVLGFYTFLGRITGQEKHGVGLRSKPLEDVKEDRGLKKWAQRSDVAVVDGFIVELPKVDRAVAEAVLDGLIDFSQTRQAATMVMACLREGLDIDSDYLRRIVALCNTHLDSVAAMIILRDFIDNVQDISVLLTANLSHDFRQLIQLVDLAASNAERALVVPRQESRWLEFNKDTDWNSRTEMLRRALEIPLALARMQDVQKCADNLSLYLTSKPDLNLGLASSHYVGFRNVLKKHKNIQHGMQTFRSLARLAWITELCRVNEQKLHAYERQMLYILLHPLPNRYRPLSVFNSTLPLAERIQLIGAIAESLPWLRQVGDCFNRAQKLEAKMKWTLAASLPEDQRQALLKLEENERHTFTFQEALQACSTYLARLEREVTGHTATGSSVPASALRSGGAGRVTASEADTYFTAALLEKRYVPAA